MRKLTVIAFMTLIMGSTASAYVVNGDGSVTLEYGDSYGSVAADFGLNYLNLGYYNGQNPDSDVVQPGQTIHLGESSYGSYYGGSGWTDYGYSDQTYADGNTSYYYDDTDYSYSWGVESDYTDAYGNSYGIVDEGYGYGDYYSSPEVYGSSSVYTGYGDASGYNAARASELNNDVVIPAGYTYSASSYLGDGGYDMGFIDSICLDGNGGTFLAPGGGICAVTTAIHMAGKMAGLTVLQANPHVNGDGTTGVSYAAPEDQASFNAGTSDLVMRNDTGSDIVLKCNYSGGTVSASFSNYDYGNGCFERDAR